MGKVKKSSTVVKLISTALTGVCRHILVKKGAPLVTQIRYDRVAKRRVLFKEAKKRKIAEIKR